MPLPPDILDHPEALRPLVERPERTGLFLDLDGTLCSLVDAPEDVRMPPETRALLRELHDRYGAVVVISGRQARSLARIVDLPPLTYVGNHGLEVIEENRRRILLPEDVAARMRRLEEALRALGVEGTLLELKELSHAIHYRRSPDPGRTRQQVLEALDGLDLQGTRITEGKMLVQIRPDYPLDKGKALEMVALERGVDRVLYAGDDTTDLDAFRTISELGGRGGMYGVKVAVWHPDTPRELLDQADFVVQGVEAVQELLRRLST